MKNRRLFFSVFSGIIYEIEEDEVKNLDEGQIPLTSRPSKNCKKCFGRGYDSRDVKSNIYNLCTKCMRKHIDRNWTPVNVKLPS